MWDKSLEHEDDNCHTIEEALHAIRETIISMYPEAVSVDISVTAEGISATPTFRTDIKGYTMQNISGKWVKGQSEVKQ